MKFFDSLMFAFCAMTVAPVFAADRITIAAASDLKFCMDEIVGMFKQTHADAAIDVTYGSSGNFSTQIKQGAPFDLYFSADIEFPRELAKAGLAASQVQLYAVGRIVLWSPTLDAAKMPLADLARPDMQKIAIANPQHAPYGKRAEEALRATGMWDKVASRLVLGENIAQTAQFVQSGNAQIGIIALSLVLSPELAGKGSYYLVPENLHQPLEQGFIITRHGARSILARSFADYIQTPEARARMIRYGFALGGERLARREQTREHVPQQR
jgi:molybdate transport system substrate-binding protein